ncbi:MAG TPA: site-specific integrase [Solirubrobacterales bacterium]|nr:site-specific integrase [Solirubrobacterales bacterium]
MSNAKRSPALQGIELRTDAKGRKRYRGTARDRSAGRHLKGPWTPSLAAARSWRIDALARIEAGTLSAVSGPTVEEAAAIFIESIGSGAFRQRNGHSYKPSVVREYQRILDKQVVPEFRPKHLARLQRPELQRWADGLTVDRSPSTVRNIVASLRALIAFAELRGWVHVNPSDGLRLPTGERQRDRIASPREAAELIEAMRSTDRAALGCAVYAGLRLGELLALDVTAVDLEGGWLHVHRSWDRGAKEFVTVKNRKPRKVPIIEKLADILGNHLGLLDDPEEGLLFPSANRSDWPTDPGILRRRTHKRWKDAELTSLGFHEARHTYASIAIAAGLNPKTLSTYMGHSTITITFDRYGHLMPGSEDEARALLNSYLDDDV